MCARLRIFTFIVVPRLVASIDAFATSSSPSSSVCVLFRNFSRFCSISCFFFRHESRSRSFRHRFVRCGAVAQAKHFLGVCVSVRRDSVTMHNGPVDGPYKNKHTYVVWCVSAVPETVYFSTPYADGTLRVLLCHRLHPCLCDQRRMACAAQTCSSTSRRKIVHWLECKINIQMGHWRCCLKQNQCC